MSTLVILAAGAGSRFGGAKQLEPVGPSQETILDYSIHDGVVAGFDRVVLVVRPEHRRIFEEFAARRWARRVAVDIAEQDPAMRIAGSKVSRSRPWGTAQAVLSAAPKIEGAFAVINGDDFYGSRAMAVIATWVRSVVDRGSVRSAPEYAIVAFQLVDTLAGAARSGAGNDVAVSRAILDVDAEGRLSAIVESKAILAGGAAMASGVDGFRPVAPDTPVSMNMWGFNNAVLSQLETAFAEFCSQALRSGTEGDAELMLPGFVNDLLARKAASVRVLSGEGSPTGITHPSDRSRMSELFRSLVERGEYPTPVWG